MPHLPHLSIGALGPLIITLNGQLRTEQAYDKAWALLVFLAHAPEQTHRRERLAGLLWPDHTDDAARTNLRQALARLRRALDNGAAFAGNTQATPPHLLTTRNDVQFNAASIYTFDVTEFSTLLHACATHAHRLAESCPVCAERRQRAVALYRGPFLDHFHIADSDLFEEWATLVREPLHQQALNALAALVVYHERLGNYAQALHFGERQLALDPWREEAYRQIMRLQALNGQRSAALHTYERCRTLLEVELGVTPASETTAFYEQLRAADGDGALKSDFLALPSKRRHNLPLQPTPFVGREQELAALAALIADPAIRLITLLGPGGSGKTRLALQVASEAGEAFLDGTFFVNLAPLTAAEHIVPALAAALDFALTSRADPLSDLLTYLRAKDLLLVLDNYEHLLVSTPLDSAAMSVDGATVLLTALMQCAPGVSIIVTSRARLNLHGEWTFDVGGLAMPADASRSGEGHLADFAHSSAVALFLQTACRVQQGFAPTAEDRAAIVHICQLVQGMPLALELAAAWVRVLTCPEIADEIAQSLSFLTTTMRDLPERHRSLQAVFEHSWKLLSAAEQRVFAACSGFRGGFTREAAAAVSRVTIPASLSLLTGLVDKSLVRSNRDGRYELHELARQYAAARLADAGEEAQTRQRHLAFFMHFAEAAEPQIRGGDQPALWHNRVESEHDNLRAAIAWSLNGGEIEPGLRIVAALWEFWMNRGHASEGQRQAERFLAHPDVTAHPVLRAKVLHTAGVCALYQNHIHIALIWLAEAEAVGRTLGESGKYVVAMALIAQGFIRSTLQEFDAVEPLSQEALVLGEELQVAWVQGDALIQLGRLAWRQGDFERARKRFVRCLEVYGPSYMSGLVYSSMGMMLYEQGDYTVASAHLHQSLAVFEKTGDKLRTSHTLSQLARIMIIQGDGSEAKELLEKAVKLTLDTAQPTSRVHPLDLLGRLAQRRGDYAEARTLHEECLALSVEMENQAWIAHSLEAFACLAMRQERAEVAAHLFATAAVYATSIELKRDPVWIQEHDRFIHLTSQQLGEAAFAAAWAMGAAMTLEDAVAFMQSVRWG